MIKAVALTWWLALAVLAALATLVALDGVTGLHVGWRNLTAVCVQMGLLCLSAALLTMALSAAAGRRLVGIAAVGAYLLVAYVWFGLSDVVAWLAPARPWSLWRWYLADDPLTQGLDVGGAAVLLAVGAVSVAAGAWAFGRRDLHA